MTTSRLRGGVIYLGYLLVATVCVLLFLEGVLRLGFDRPVGLFHIRPLDGSGLYHPNSAIRMYTGPVPYTIKTNALGFRGPEISVKKPAGVTRIIALGDSVTDGFYVENEDTYPAVLQRSLQQSGYAVEVVNAARGGATIDRELAIYDQYCAPLQPDVVVLTFVTNDIDDLQGLSRAALVRSTIDLEEAELKSGALLLASTAVGEFILDLSLRARFENYRRFDREADGSPWERGHEIPGNRDYADNLQHFLGKAKENDSILLYDTYSEAQRALVDN